MTRHFFLLGAKDENEVLWSQEMDGNCCGSWRFTKATGQKTRKVFGPVAFLGLTTKTGAAGYFGRLIYSHRTSSFWNKYATLFPHYDMAPDMEPPPLHLKSKMTQHGEIAMSFAHIFEGRRMWTRFSWWMVAVPPTKRKYNMRVFLYVVSTMIWEIYIEHWHAQAHRHKITRPSLDLTDQDGRGRLIC